MSGMSLKLPGQLDNQNCIDEIYFLNFFIVSYCFTWPCLPDALHPSDLPMVITAVAIVGKLAMSASFTNIYVYAAELYPTSLR